MWMERAAQPSAADAVRLPAAAGYFYSADPVGLRRELDWCYAHSLGPGTPSAGAAPDPARSPIAIISPHAGLRYSGPFAANAYHRLGHVQTAVVLGPNHRRIGAPWAVAPPFSWRTPLGDIPGDPALVEALRTECPFLEVDERAHADEHSIELQAVFLRDALGPSIRMVAIAGWGSERAQLEAIGHALAVVQAKHPCLLVASTDLSHYLPDEAARRCDRLTLAAMVSLDTDLLVRRLESREAALCGAGPVVSVLVAVRELGAASARLLRYGTSADTGGGADAVVGYAALRVDLPSETAPADRAQAKA